MESFRDLLTKNKDALVYITGIGYDKGASLGLGTKNAPKVIMELSQHIPPYTMDGESIKDIKLYNNGILNPTCILDIEKEMKKLYQDDIFNIVLGGDHSISIALEKLFLEKAKKENKEPVIIHLDAHPDFCDFYDGSKYSHACPNMRAYENGYKLENITLIGIRGYEEQEVEFFNKHPEIKIYNASYILENGITTMINEIIDKYKDEKYMVYISYDIDINDISHAPGTGTPEAFGINPYEVLKILKALFINLNVKAMDIVEVSPDLDDANNTTSWLAIKTLYELFKILIDKRGK